MRRYWKTDKNGTKYYTEDTCRRCGGLGGADAWKFTGWNCYRCGGTGKDPNPEVIKVYTPEYEAKLQKQREKRFEKKMLARKAEAETANRAFLEKNGFNAEGYTFVVLGDTYKAKDELKDLGCKFNGILGWHSPKELDGYRTMKVSIDDAYDKDFTGTYTWQMWKTDLKGKIEKANDDYRKETEGVSEYIGSIKDKVDTEAVYMRSVYWEQPSYCEWNGMEIMYIHTFKIGSDILIWKTGCGLGNIEEGSEVHLKGTIKDHKEYDGVKQTVLTRCKVERR